jgi:hypothetical protein
MRHMSATVGLRRWLYCGALALTACDSGTDGDGPLATDAGNDATVTDATRDSGDVSDGPLKVRMRVVAPPASGETGGIGGTPEYLSGQNAAADLVSLQYAIRSVAICRTLTPQGSGFTDARDCITLYEGPGAAVLEYDPSTDLTSLIETARGLEAPFVDLATAAGRATITAERELAPNELGTYEYGIVTWYPPIKFQASVTLDPSTTLRTRDGVGMSRTVGADSYRQYFTQSETAFASADPSELAVVLLPNGGNWFKFQRPLVLGGTSPGADAGMDDASVATGGTVNVDLVFDSEALVTAFSERADESPRVCLLDTTGAGFDIPMLDLAPIVRTGDVDGVREDWFADLGGDLGYRLSLYGVTPDANRTVYGVLSRAVMSGPNVTPSGWFSAPKIAGVTVADDGTLSFADAEGVEIVRGFSRTAEPALPGTPIAAELRCTGNDERPSPHGFFLEGCATGSWRVVSFLAR